MENFIKVNQTTLAIIQGDITKYKADIIVNAANSSLLGGGGVDGAIHKAGGKTILEECVKIRERQGGCSIGEAVITTAGNLPASYVVHTVGPVWNEGTNNEPEKLSNCYKNSLALSTQYKARSVAFPNISTGIYRFPKLLAADIAIETVKSYLHSLGQDNHEFNVIAFVCFDDENYTIYRNKLITS